MDYNAVMTGFTKLFSTIIHSTIWREPAHIKVVWVTMLAMTDRNGRVMASLPGLADAARVSLPECEEALAKLKSPDVYSRTKDHEGRRIRDIDGGWEVLNYLKYREMRNDDERRIQSRHNTANHRARKANSLTVSHGKPLSAQAEAEAEADAEELPKKVVQRRKPLPYHLDPRFNALLKRYPPAKRGRPATSFTIWTGLSEAEKARLEGELLAYLSKTKPDFWTRFDSWVEAWSAGPQESVRPAVVEQDFSCPKCGRAFSCGTNLEGHLLDHQLGRVT